MNNGKKESIIDCITAFLDVVSILLFSVIYNSILTTLRC